eukprot:3673456-Rhodomonas_salina.1
MGTTLPFMARMLLFWAAALTTGVVWGREGSGKGGTLCWLWWGKHRHQLKQRWYEPTRALQDVRGRASGNREGRSARQRLISSGCNASWRRPRWEGCGKCVGSVGAVFGGSAAVYGAAMDGDDTALDGGNVTAAALTWVLLGQRRQREKRDKLLAVVAKAQQTVDAAMVGAYAPAMRCPVLT